MDSWLMSFRLAYLRSIANSWDSGNYKSILLGADNILDANEKFIKNGFVDYFKNLRNVNIKIKLIKQEDEGKKTKWEPMETAGWIGLNDKFIINIPKKPETKDQSGKLAEYYQLFPTLLGTQESKEECDQHQGRVASELPQDLGTNPGPFLELGGVTLRAIALAWKDDHFCKELTNPSENDATPVLSKYLGYNNPWNFSIQFVETPETDYKKIVNTIELNYPESPDVNFRAIALTSYNNTGPAYPFTCG